jgi:hypothetical protein
VLDGEKNEEIISALKRIEEIAKKKIDMVKPIKPYIENLSKNKNKEIINLSSSIKELFSKAERRKNLEEKRKLMQQKEKEFLEGKITGQEYAKIRKEYLILRD